MHRLTTAALLALLPSLALAQGTETRDSAGALGPAPEGPAQVVHGRVTSDWPATGALMDQWGAFCTGTLISPKIVLTAAHCLEDGAPTSVWFGDEPDVSGEDVPVADVVIHPDYDFWSIPSNDIGLVVLRHEASAEPAVYDRGDAWDLVGTDLIYVGYGATEGTGGEGLKKEAVATVEDIDSDVLVVRPVDGGACWGDSGGPLYREADGAILVSGVVSFGYTDDCMDLGGNTRTDWYTDWVMARIDEHDPQELDPDPTEPESRRMACSAAGSAPVGALWAWLVVGPLLILRRRR